MATHQVQAAAIASKPAADHSPMLGDSEANIPNDAHHHQTDANAGSGSFSSWLPVLLGLFFLTLNSATAIVRSHGDAAAVAFVGFTYSDLVALFLCLRMYERSRAGSAKRTWLKIAVWIETALLTFAFSGKVAAVMPPPVAMVVWLVAFATVAGGFFAFFVYQEEEEQCTSSKEKHTPRCRRGAGCGGEEAMTAAGAARTAPAPTTHKSPLL